MTTDFQRQVAIVYQGGILSKSLLIEQQIEPLSNGKQLV